MVITMAFLSLPRVSYSFEQNLQELQKGPLPDEVLTALDETWLIPKAGTQNYWHGELTYLNDVKESLARIC
jgi:aflatoxin B1 aldehyde reductase